MPFFKHCSNTSAPRIKSSSAVVHAPMKQPSSFVPATALIGCTLSGEGNRATCGSKLSSGIWKLSIMTIH